MAQFKKYLFDKLFGTSTGYVLDFTNMTFASFIEESVGINIYTSRYDKYGDSKGKRLKVFFDVEDNLRVAKLLQDLLDYYPSSVSEAKKEEHKDLYEQCKKEIEILLSDSDFYSDKLNFDDNSTNLTIKELKNSLENDLNARKFNVALDRLHTYCVIYFRSKADKLYLYTNKEKPLHAIAGEVLKALSIHQSEMTLKILRSSLSTLDNFNKVRNEQSLAHDNEILGNSESKLIVDWIISLLGYFEECCEIFFQKTKNIELNNDDISF